MSARTPPEVVSQGEVWERMRVVTIRNLTRANVVAERILLADTSMTRAWGLLGRSRVDAGSGLLIRPSSGVHTIGMRFAIDVVGLDAQMRVVRVWPDLLPFRLTAVRFSIRSVLELAAGQIVATGLQVGDCLKADFFPDANGAHS